MGYCRVQTKSSQTYNLFLFASLSPFRSLKNAHIGLYTKLQIFGNYYFILF
jgi:hypothetical protein